MLSSYTILLYSYICVLILVHMCHHTAVYVSPQAHSYSARLQSPYTRTLYYCTTVLLCMCPDTSTDVSSYCCICVPAGTQLQCSTPITSSPDIWSSGYTHTHTHAYGYIVRIYIVTVYLSGRLATQTLSDTSIFYQIKSLIFKCSV